METVPGSSTCFHGSGGGPPSTIASSRNESSVTLKSAQRAACLPDIRHKVDGTIGHRLQNFYSDVGNEDKLKTDVNKTEVNIAHCQKRIVTLL